MHEKEVTNTGPGRDALSEGKSGRTLCGESSIRPEEASHRPGDGSTTHRELLAPTSQGEGVGVAYQSPPDHTVVQVHVVFKDMC